MAEPYQPLQEQWCDGISSWSFPGSLSVQWKTWQVNTLHFHPNQWSGVRGFILVLALSLFNWWTCIMFWPTENKICDYSQYVWLAHITPGWKIWPITSCLTEKKILLRSQTQNPIQTSAVTKILSVITTKLFLGSVVVIVLSSIGISNVNVNIML